MNRVSLPIERILQTPESADGEPIGESQEGRPILAHRLGNGPLRASLIGGCHADEPVGPAMLQRLAAYLQSLDEDDELLTRISWTLVPHVNPDGAERNRPWSDKLVPIDNHLGEPDSGYDLVTYARSVVREPPGEDIEFGFPRDEDDTGARPENRAVARLLDSRAPLHLHGSFHGMAFAPGPWFLLERSWIGRTATMRSRLRQIVREMGYNLLDWDRLGDKGFERIDEGFSTRPDSRAMTRHFLDRDDPETAALFRPSSMEHARSLGGDPLTFVSEMPLFLHPDPAILSSRRAEFRAWLSDLVTHRPPHDARTAFAAAGLRPMPLGDQMRLQLSLLQEVLSTVAAGEIPAP